MKTQNTFTPNRVIAAAAVVMFSLLVNVGATKAQFAQSVVLLRGTVRSLESGKAISVKLSVRAANDTAVEITASRSNSATGGYAIVLKPSKKYWIHLESPGVFTKDTLIETPATQSSVQLTHDFTVNTLESENASAPAALTISTEIKHD